MAVKKVMSETSFDYDRFAEDLRKWCKENSKTLSYLSSDVCLRHESYLSGALKKKCLPPNIALVLAKRAGIELKDYKIKRTVNTPAQVEVKADEKMEAAEGWSCFLKVDEEIGVAMLKIFKDGREVCTGRSYTYGGDEQGIIQGISYAAHMCYKMVQQQNLAHAVMAEEGVDTEQDTDANPLARVIFKDWIKRYENDNSKAGTLARYVKNHYEKIPSTGKKKIRSYLRLNHGEAHLMVFDGIWDQYFKWCEANAVENNKRLGVAVN